MRLPFETVEMWTEAPVNSTLHGRSIPRNEDVPGHNVIKGYSAPSGRRVGDGVDLFVPAGTPVYAMHEGTIIRMAEPEGRLGCLYIENRELGVLTVYAHLNVKDALRVGDEVEEGQVIGHVNRQLKHPHLHLEMWVHGNAVASRTPGGLKLRIKKWVNTFKQAA
jgi:murein DD-endopeptidase MepM/ murein hydrolase activator NlpD